MPITIRTARRDDIGPIAELIVSSAPELYRYLYRDRVMDYVRHQFATGLGISGWPNVTVAVNEKNEVVGTGCFYDRSQNERLRGETPQVVASFFSEAEAAELGTRFKSIASYVQPPAEGEVYLANFGVAPQLRGQGVGSQMLREQIAQVRAAGYATFGLDVSIENPRAEGLYARMGLKVVRENASPLAHVGVPGSRKMELAL